MTSFSRQKSLNLKKGKGNFLENDEFYTHVKFQFHCVKTEEVVWTWPEQCKKSPVYVRTYSHSKVYQMKLVIWWQAHGFEPPTIRSEDQYANHYNTMPPFNQP